MNTPLPNATVGTAASRSLLHSWALGGVGTAWIIIVVAAYYRRAWALAVAAGGLEWHDMRGVVGPLVVAVPTIAAVLLARAFGRRDAPRWTASPRVVAALAVVLALAAFGAWLQFAGARSVPFLREATIRNLSAIGAALLVSWDAFVCGTLLLAALAWPPLEGLEAFLFRVATGFIVVSYLSLALASAGLYRPHAVTAMLLVIGLIGVARLRRHSASAARQAFRSVSAFLKHASRSDVAWAAIAATAIAIGLVGALAPETEFDALWYHLSLPQVWLQHGRPTDVPTEYVALYPLTWELVFGAGLAVAGPVAAKLLHFVCLPLTALAVWVLVKRFFPRVSPTLAAAVFVTVPTVLWESTTAYIDLALALYVTLGLHAWLMYLTTLPDDSGRVMPDIGAPSVSETRASNPWLMLAAFCLGASASIKHLGLIVVVAVACATCLRLAKRRSLPRSLVPALLLMTTAFAMAAPWYWRAWAATGNPFFPEMYRLFGASTPRWDAVAERGLDHFKAHFGTSRTPLHLALLPWNMTTHSAAFAGCLGPIFLIALPSTAWLIGRRQPDRPLHAPGWLAGIAVAYAVVWASPVSSFQLRFLLPIIPALAVLAAAGVCAFTAALSGQAVRTACVTLLAVVMVVNLPPFVPFHEGDRSGWTGWLTHVVRSVPLGVVTGRQAADDYLRQHVPSYGAWQWGATHLPENARVLEFGGGDNFYATRNRLSMDAVAARGAWASGPGADERVQAALGRLGVSHILFVKRELPALAAQRTAIALESYRTRRLALLYEDDQALVYMVKTSSER